MSTDHEPLAVGTDLLGLPRRRSREVSGPTEVRALGGRVVVRRSAHPQQRPGVGLVVKHVLDRVVAAVLLLVLLPVLLTIAVAVKATSRGPVLFRQRRVGRDGRAFEILKFRSMSVLHIGEGYRPGLGAAPGGIEGADRRTPLGRVLRRCSLDELPQLLNVLLGDMSLVGPRPERPEFVELFADEVPGYADRHRVKGGITGLAQVRGLRGQTSIARRAAADVAYIEGWSLWLDVKILARTLLAVTRGSESS